MKTSSFVRLIGLALQSSLVLLQPIQQAVAQDATAPAADAPYKIVSPVGESTAKPIAMASRLETLDGKTVCMVWNHAFKADVTHAAIAAELKKRHPGIKIVTYTELPDAPEPELVGTPQTIS